MMKIEIPLEEVYRQKAICLRGAEMIKDLKRGVPLDPLEVTEVLEALRGNTFPDWIYLYPQLIGEYIRKVEESLP